MTNKEKAIEHVENIILKEQIQGITFLSKLYEEFLKQLQSKDESEITNEYLIAVMDLGIDIPSFNYDLIRITYV
jgi:hypothetical protein